MMLEADGIWPLVFLYKESLAQGKPDVRMV